MISDSQALRDAIRSGEICPSKDRPRWERAVAAIYALESDRADGAVAHDGTKFLVLLPQPPEPPR